MIKLGPDQIKQLCTAASFERGQRYLEEGRVKIKEASPTKISASVAGTSNYRVEVDLEDEEGISATCTCPYDWEGYCKHIVATLLAMLEDREMIESMVEASSEKQQSMDMRLKRVEPEALRSFLRREMERLPELRDRFMACFSTGGEGKSLADYKEEVESLYDLAEDRGLVPYGEEIDFKPLKELAEIYIQKGDFLEAAKIYQALFETIAEKMDNVDDSDGYYGEEFSDDLDLLVDCIIEAGQDAESRRIYIKYLLDNYLRGDPDYFQDNYREALEKLCTSKEDLAYWKEMLESHIPVEIPDSQNWHSYYHANRLISMQLHLLSKLGQMAEFYALIEKHYRSSHDLTLWYARQLLEDGDREKAVKVAEEGVALFPDHLSMEIRDFLSGIYKKADPKKYRETLQSLFLHGGDWKYYDRLKKASSPEEWCERLDKILAHFTIHQGGFNRYKIIDIYLRERMYDQALEAVLSQKSLSTLSRYQNDLVYRYPKQYFNAYRELIFPFAEKEMGRRHYQEVVSYLWKMKEIEGFEGAVKEVVERLREENKRKPAFIDEMKEL
jgi:hypothetical protein